MNISENRRERRDNVDRRLMLRTLRISSDRGSNSPKRMLIQKALAVDSISNKGHTVVGNTVVNCHEDILVGTDENSF